MLDCQDFTNGTSWTVVTGHWTILGGFMLIKLGKVSDVSYDRADQSPTMKLPSKQFVKDLL